MHNECLSYYTIVKYVVISPYKYLVYPSYVNLDYRNLWKNCVVYFFYWLYQQYLGICVINLPILFIAATDTWLP